MSKTMYSKDILRNCFAVLIAISYCEFIGVSELVSSYINSSHKLQSSQSHIIITPKQEVSTDESIWTPNGVFDDQIFMARYKCNPNHGYRIELIKQDPVLFIIRDFLAAGEAEHLKHLGAPNFQRSKVVDANQQFHPGRTSSSAFLTRAQDRVVACIERRAATILSVPLVNIEPFQVVWYQETQKYDPHMDWFDKNTEAGLNELKRGGQRTTTFFVYLNDVPPHHGGATSFPNLNLEVPAVKNSAAFWKNQMSNGTDDSRTFHGGSAVIGDYEKFGLNIWVREREFV